ncbi:MAG: tRNA pseudouridine(13) synthase TruD [Candidatus Helarchaeota archaeon]
MESHPIEKEIGIETYITRLNGIGGKLRTTIEDFIVEEISPQGEIIKSQSLNQIPPRHDLNLQNLNKATTYNLVLEKYNVETFTAIQLLANFLKIPYRNIGYAGLKDKRAITTQQISISGADPQMLQNFKVKGVYLNRIHPGKPIKLGFLNGNHFIIILRQINESYSKVQPKIEEIKRQILTFNVPNYYGPQRFGVIRPISHRIGRALLLKDYELALKIYLTECFPQEKSEIREIRAILRDSWPNPDISFPKEYYYENKIVENLKEYQPNFKKIFGKVFPFHYLLLFIHAYQSYIFNKLLSIRLNIAQIPLNEAIIGDYVSILDQYSLPTKAIYEVNPSNQNSLNKAISNGKAVVMFPLFGFDLDYSHHPLADYIEKLIDEDEIDLSLFKFPNNHNIQIKVTYRPISFRPKNFTIDINDFSNASEDLYIKFIFSLNKGCYATVLLREFMKTNPLNY